MLVYPGASSATGTADSPIPSEHGESRASSSSQYARFRMSARSVLNLTQFTLKEVDERQKSPRPAPDMLNKLLKLHEAQPEKISIREVTAAIHINLYELAVILSRGAILNVQQEWPDTTFWLSPFELFSITSPDIHAYYRNSARKYTLQARNSQSRLQFLTRASRLSLTCIIPI